MYSESDQGNDGEEADELRSLSTMDTLTFRRLREGRQRRHNKSKQSDDEESAVARKTATTSGRDSMRRSNLRGNNVSEADDQSSVGDTLTTLSAASSAFWSRRANYGSGSTSGRRTRNPRGGGRGRKRCFIDICLLFVLGVVLIVKFGSIELQLEDNITKLRGGTSEQDSHPTDGASYAQWLMRQSLIAEYENDENAKPGVVNNNHDAAEAFFNDAINNLKNGMPVGRVDDDMASSQVKEEANWQRHLEQPLDEPQQQQQEIYSESLEEHQLLKIGQSAQSSNGVKDQYENAQPVSNTQGSANTQEDPLQDEIVPREPEFQGFEQALIQQQLQQAIIQKQQQQPILDLSPDSIMNTQQQNLKQLAEEASHHGEDGFKLNAQQLPLENKGIMSITKSDTSGSLSLAQLAQNQQSDHAFLLDPANLKESLQQPRPPFDQKGADATVQLLAPDSNLSEASTSDLQAISAAGRKLQIATWNIAAINNNPFEYWITYDENPSYEKIMTDIENFLESPGERDVPVSAVFTEDMFGQLEKRMNAVGWDSVRSYWDGDFKNRKIVSGFMKDPLLGSKRLASMPDRITNTINVVGSVEPVCRPTVINMYDGDLSTLQLWWSAWEKFMFDTPLAIQNNGETKTDPVYKLLQPIKKAKYPDITTEEEKVSLPLQTMCGAIFDAILVHMMNTVSHPDVWQSLKKTMVENLNKQKVPHTLDILEKVYVTSDIITLQEVSASMINKAKSRALADKFWIVAPGDLDAVRDQNSVILLSKTTFPSGPGGEITNVVEGSFEQGVNVPIAKGDILAITATDRDDTPFVIASFHGDTDGLATKPVLSAIMKVMTTNSALAKHKLIFGLDANTYEKAQAGKQQDVVDWGNHYVSFGLTSCWGDVPNPKNYTTFNSRTYLQPQLNKACKKADKRANGDVNPKDFILFQKEDFKVSRTWKDNTGEQRYIEDMAFPTFKFPSDHGILATIIEPISSQEKI